MIANRLDDASAVIIESSCQSKVCAILLRIFIVAILFNVLQWFCRPKGLLNVRLKRLDR